MGEIGWEILLWRLDMCCHVTLENISPSVSLSEQRDTDNNIKATTAPIYDVNALAIPL